MIETLKTIAESMKELITIKLNVFGFEGTAAAIIFIAVMIIKIMPKRNRRR